MLFSHLRFKLRQLNEDLKHFKSNNWKSPRNAEIYNSKTNTIGDYQDFLTTDYLKELTTRIEQGAQVLDLGCGTGVLSIPLARSGFRVTGVDISEAMLEIVRQKMTGLHIELRVGDIFKLPFGDGVFDGAITRWVIPHFNDWPLVLKEAARTLRPGGVFVFDICSTPNYELASRHGTLDYLRFGSNPTDETVTGFYASATAHELRLAANISGLEVVEIVPNGLYRNNALIAASLGADEHERFKATFAEFYRHEEVKSFVQWFDLSVTKKLPLGLVNTLTVVMRKSPQ